MKLSLRPYQVEAVRSVYQYLENHDDNPCVVTPTASGKSIMIAQIATDAVCRWRGRVLVLAHVKELLEQNAGKIKALCDGIEVGVYSAGLNSRDTDTPILVAGIQSIYNKADIIGKFDLIIVDECFPAGTIINTPRGGVPIEELYVGQPVYHAFGVGKIEAISSRPTKELVQLELSNGKTIKCTRNHPFFTDAGWKKAGELEIGSRLFSRQDVCGLRKSFSSSNMEKHSWRNMLPSRITLGKTEILFSQMSTSIYGCTEEKAYSYCQAVSGNMENRSVDCDKELSLLWKRNASSVLSWKTAVACDVEQEKILFNILLKESRESDVSQRNNTESIACSQRNWASADNSRRERHTLDDSTGTACECIGLDGGNGICSCYDRKAAERGRVSLLQVGCCDSVSLSWDSIGRKQSFVQENAGKGQENPRLDGGVRVVDIAYIKLESPCVVYNLQVAGHPTYYADGILVHNCHMIPQEGEGVYRSFIKAMQKKNPLLRVIGFTATPYRMKGGLICKPENILNKICYEVGIKELIAHGYLSPLISFAGKAEADLSSLHIRGGEFIADEVEKAMDEERLVVSACREIYEKTMDRKSVLIFTSSVKHCRHVVKILSEMAHQEVAIVTGDTPPDERAEILDRFKGVEIKDLLGDAKPPLKFLCNVNVLTTGFDAPNVDCIALLRPTNSPGLLVQMIGRGFRLSPETGKKNCLILDYGENIMRHGPIDCIRIHERGKGNGKAPAKMCPECRALIHASYSICPECGFVFPVNNRNIKISPYASHDGVLSGQITYEEYEVLDVSYEIHHKRGDSSAPPTLQVNYRVGLYQFKHEWVCPEHSGYARQKFEKWWYMRAAVGVLAPATVEEALSMARDGLLAEPKKIRVQIVSGEKYERIVKVELGERPRFTPVEADEEIPF